MTKQVRSLDCTLALTQKLRNKPVQNNHWVRVNQSALFLSTIIKS